MRCVRERPVGPRRSGYAGAIDTGAIGKLSADAARIFRARSFPFLALIDERGRPHNTPVWVDVDDEGNIVVNTAEGRVKDRLLQVGAVVAVSALDPEDPYRYVTVRGRVALRTREGAWEMIDALSRKYRGKDYTGKREQRVTVIIEPEHVIVR